MAKLQAPSVSGLSVKILQANYVKLSWNAVGSNFYYEVQYSSSTDKSNIGNTWTRIAYANSNSYFIDDNCIASATYYQFRVRTVYNGFSNGQWSITDIYLTPDSNSYTIDLTPKMTLSSQFINQYFNKNGKSSYIDFENDTFYATLVRSGFTYDPSNAYYTQAEDYYVTNSGSQMVYDTLPIVCKSKDRVIPAVIDDVIYAFERFQSICKISNDGGQNWYIYDALGFRAGNPVEDCIAQQNSSNTYVLGYNYIFQGYENKNITFDSTTVHLSNTEYTLEYVDTSSKYGVEVEAFTRMAPLPSSLDQVCESFNVDDYMFVGAAADKCCVYNIFNPSVESDPNSNRYGQNVFDPTEYSITGTDDAVIKKIQFYADPNLGSDYGTFYFLVVGVWKRDLNGNKIGIDTSSDIKGVYMMDRTIETEPNPDYDASIPTSDSNPQNLVTGFTINGFNRVFGNTPEERIRISEYSSISRDETYLILGLEPEKWDTVVDPNPPDGYDEAYRYYKKQLYTTYKHRMWQAVGSIDGTTWEPVVQDYYASFQLNWMNRNNTRDHKDWSGRIIYVKPETIFTTKFSNTDESKVTMDQNDNIFTLSVPNLEISGFYGYTQGALIHNLYGVLIGYYKFDYKEDSPVSIEFNNKIMFTAEMDPYTEIIEEDDSNIIKLADPTLAPLFDKMGPESYFNDDYLLTSFAKYYVDFISTGDASAYNNLFNLIDSKYARSEKFNEYLYSEFYKRSQITDLDARKKITKFLMSRNNDFWSAKGTAESYKFLFKLLYNKDVTIESQSLNRFQYYVTVSTEAMSSELVGSRIYSDTGSADVVYYIRQIDNGVKHWKLTLNNLVGKFVTGQTIKCDDVPYFNSTVYKPVLGDSVNTYSQELLNSSDSYYVMKIISELQTKDYKKDVMYFVHPIGFDFMGITLVTVLLNGGNDLKHLETIVNFYRTIRFDAGAGRVFPDQYPKLDRDEPDPEYQYDANGNLEYESDPRGGQDVLSYLGISEDDYNDSFNNEELVIDGVTTLPYDRRKEFTPTWDSSNARFTNYISENSKKLKDTIGNPRDPDEPTQVNLGSTKFD